MGGAAVTARLRVGAVRGEIVTLGLPFALRGLKRRLISPRCALRPRAQTVLFFAAPSAAALKSVWDLSEGELGSVAVGRGGLEMVRWPQ